ncbi:MAG: hypothetical protein UT12_C0019G0009 [Candidatus Curtissbacteria bacterium GW2011_GWC2_38_9]|uniref:Uncharacterized protein n=3 Tax=Candidatus Curtissiibacteriota TaxID=1752717 RepID=A0A1F5HT32_9BACT|nr:MAG: hypothetical protein UT12_C0019G0009 [Candidatus Curtissbacteria bacterium GW2011_GWC2_38_9]KKS03260.1 MAG: hypothetical protein UU56_C0021G0008 [Candidatus Curtissbacteria bacterium GW2011_GWA2_41_24]OGD90076.1 MAG: hypothetical protein A2Z54_02735 [Candidatus Curtissbacteria bacterium RIFCSPHIGHO2_02_39_8]OGE07220.1 MAG: hypothetical protein A2W70_02180 [Candidatus Curtissbacteria bacterium RIFCSPLOWO2_02_41_11]
MDTRINENLKQDVPNTSKPQPRHPVTGIPIEECRKILGKAAEKMTDMEIESLRDVFIVLSDLAIDSYLTKRTKN